MTGILVPVSGSVGTAGCRFFCWDGEGRQRKVASLRGVDAGGGVFAVLWGGWRGTPEKGGIGPGVDAGGDVFEILRGGCG